MTAFLMRAALDQPPAGGGVLNLVETAYGVLSPANRANAPHTFSFTLTTGSATRRALFLLSMVNKSGNTPSGSLRPSSVTAGSTALIEAAYFYRDISPTGVYLGIWGGDISAEPLSFTVTANASDSANSRALCSALVFDGSLSSFAALASGSGMTTQTAGDVVTAPVAASAGDLVVGLSILDDKNLTIPTWSALTHRDLSQTSGTSNNAHSAAIAHDILAADRASSAETINWADGEINTIAAGLVAAFR